MTPFIKICGLKNEAAIAAARDAGATHAGFMYFEKSPRHVSLDEMRALGPLTGAMQRAAVLVNRGDDIIREVVAALAPHLLQLHGEESPARVAAIKALTGLPVMKVLSVATAADVDAARAYGGADLVMFDAKAPKSADRPGGNGVTFDWALLSGVTLDVPWVLSGGLTPESVADAIRQTGTGGVDVSSGVEDAPGQKSSARIAAFTIAARAAYGLPVLDHAL